MTRIQPFPAPCAEKARAALPRPAGTAVFVLTHVARSALCGRFGLEDSQLDRALGLLGAARVEDPDVPHGPIEADAAELLARLAEGRLPWFIHACPRWRRDVLRRYPQLSALFSPARPAPCPARVAVVGCAARKAALAREGWTEALTVREAALRLIRGGMRPVRGMPCAPGGPGWLERVFLRADRLAGGDCKPLPSFVPERRFAGVETARFSLLGRDVRVARVRGAAQMERLLGSFGPHALPWQVIEVLVCAGGCDRG